MADLDINRPIIRKASLQALRKAESQEGFSWQQEQHAAVALPGKSNTYGLAHVAGNHYSEVPSLKHQLDLPAILVFPLYIMQRIVCMQRIVQC